MAGGNRRTYDLMEHIDNDATFNQLPAKDKWKKLKAAVPKPARPQSGFTRFFSEYMTKAKKSGAPKELMAEAANAWAQLSEEEKDTWKQSCADEQEAYRRSAEEYKQIKNSLKKPSTAYGLFVKERWSALKAKPKTGRGVKPGFKSTTKKISQEWKKLSAKDKQKYVDEAKRLRTLYVTERDAILNGTRRQFNMNWIGGEEDVQMAEE
ncbi:unnamed protein product [Orchesella dallaii]|uniref:HMG box domain-containing protein n=1 Tax=Orchesella dallaii TaxID=48710 RepID=A0ABP1RX79_9HEXA